MKNENDFQNITSLTKVLPVKLELTSCLGLKNCSGVYELVYFTTLNKTVLV